MCTNQDISNIPFIMRGNNFLVHRHKKDLPHITCIFHLFKYEAKSFFLVSAIFHHISLLRLLPKSYFKVSTFHPNFLGSSSFKGSSQQMHYVVLKLIQKQRFYVGHLYEVNIYTYHTFYCLHCIL